MLKVQVNDLDDTQNKKVVQNKESNGLTLGDLTHHVQAQSVVDETKKRKRIQVLSDSEEEEEEEEKEVEEKIVEPMQEVD